MTRSHEGPVWQVAWAHPKFGALLASCSYDGRVIVWKETAGGWIRAKEHTAHDSSVNSVAWAPHELGLSLACASSDGKVSVLTYRTEAAAWHVEEWGAHQIGCNAVSWCPSARPASLISALGGAAAAPPPAERRIATGGCDNLVKIWRCGEDGAWRAEAELAGHTDWVRDVAWAPTIGVPGHTVVSCSQDRTVLVWKSGDAAAPWSKRPLAKDAFPDTLWRVAFSPAGNLLAVAGGDNRVTLWREGLDGEWEGVADVDQAALALAPAPAPAPK